MRIYDGAPQTAARQSNLLQGKIMDENTLKVRNARLEDAAELNRIYSDYVVNTAITFEDDAISDDEFKDRMKGIMSFYPYFVCESGGEIVGYAYAGQFKNRSAYDWAVETTVYVKRGCGRAGIGSALYGALERALKRQGINNMYACIAVPKVEDEYLTLGSVRFHRKMGFKTVGRFVSCGCKFGRWYDMVWMQKVIGPHDANPARPKPYKSV